MISYDSIYEATPESREDLRDLANRLRKALKIPSDQIYVDVTKMLEELYDLDDDFSFDVVSDNELEYGVQAQTDIIHNQIIIKESVYEGAINNNGRDRMTITHEVPHLILHHPNTLTLYRRTDKIPLYKNPEWQAECFAGEFLMPYNLIKNMSQAEVMDKCKVTASAAHYQLTHI